MYSVHWCTVTLYGRGDPSKIHPSMAKSCFRCWDLDALRHHTNYQLSTRLASELAMGWYHICWYRYDIYHDLKILALLIHHLYRLLHHSLVNTLCKPCKLILSYFVMFLSKLNWMNEKVVNFQSALVQTRGIRLPNKILAFSHIIVCP